MPKKSIKEIKECENEDEHYKPSGELVNFYTIKDIQPFLRTYINPYKDIHGFSIPFRLLIVSPSGSGKTLALLNLLKEFQDTFNHLLLITQNKSESLYSLLESKIDPDLIDIREGIEEFNKINIDEYFSDLAKQYLCVFDDMVCEKKQQQIEIVFIRARKLGGSVSCIYLSQSYFQTPIIIRKNLSHLILKRLGNKNDLDNILRDHAISVDKTQLKNMYDECMEVRIGDDNEDGILNHLLIDLTAKPDKAFRYGFNIYLNPDDYTENEKIKSNIDYIDNDNSKKSKSARTGYISEKRKIKQNRNANKIIKDAIK